MTSHPARTPLAALAGIAVIAWPLLFAALAYGPIQHIMHEKYGALFTLFVLPFIVLFGATAAAGAWTWGAFLLNTAFSDEPSRSDASITATPFIALALVVVTFSYGAFPWSIVPLVVAGLACTAVTILSWQGSQQQAA